MAFLRSRAKIPKSPKCPSLASPPPSTIQQPSTPIKAREHSNPLHSPPMNHSNLSSPSDSKTPPRALGFRAGIEASAPRRSLRLASKSNGPESAMADDARRGSRRQGTDLCRSTDSGEGKGDAVDAGSGSSRRKGRGRGGNHGAGEGSSGSPDADSAVRGSDLRSSGVDGAVVDDAGAGKGNGVDLNADGGGSLDSDLGIASGESERERFGRVLDLETGNVGGKSKTRNVAGVVLESAAKRAKRTRNLVEDGGMEGVEKKLESSGWGFGKESCTVSGSLEEKELQQTELVSDVHVMGKDGEREGIDKQTVESSSCYSMRCSKRKSQRLIEKGDGGLHSDCMLDLNSVPEDGGEKMTALKEAEFSCNRDQNVSKDGLGTDCAMRYLRRGARFVGDGKRDFGFDLNLDLNSVVSDGKELGLKETEAFDGDRVVGKGINRNRIISDNELPSVSSWKYSRWSGKHEKTMRKADINTSLSLNSFSGDLNENSSLNLRSGTRIVRRRVEVVDVDSDGVKNGRRVEVVDVDSDGAENEVKGGLKEGDEKEVVTAVNGSTSVLREEEYNKEERRNQNGIKVNELLDPIVNVGGTFEGERRYSKKDKGKGKLLENDYLPIGHDGAALDPDMIDAGFSEHHVLEEAASTWLMEGEKLFKMEPEGWRRKADERMDVVERNKARFLVTAKEFASKFAHFKDEDEGDNSSSHSLEIENEPEIEDWPGPFSTAMRIIEDRAKKLNARQGNSVSVASKSSPIIKWLPSQDRSHMRLTPVAPLLQDLCFNLLCKNAEAITSLRGIPDALKSKLSRWLCDSRKMSCHILGLLASESPFEICLTDCSWLAEDQLREILGGCNMDQLRVLQFDLCGRCLPDYILRETLARSSNCLPSLITISLRGAYRLSDDGLAALVSSAPLLKSVNLCQCSLLTAAGVITLAEKFDLLRELYIDECQNVDAMLILPALKKLKHLEVLSVAGIPNVCDKFIRELLSVCGPNMKELVLADCGRLTDSSLKAIAENCSGLHSVDLGGLQKLTDLSLRLLANGCRSLQVLKLRRNGFSDEGIAAFLEASGESLRELSLNNVKEVAHHTAIALSARCSKMLYSLDLSWCRKVMDEALGLIVDKCLALRLLKLFGCTQITNKFLDGHSNPHVEIVGLKAAPILTHLVVPDSLEAALRY